jgi:hypothetical protein
MFVYTSFLLFYKFQAIADSFYLKVGQGNPRDPPDL